MIAMTRWMRRARWLALALALWFSSAGVVMAKGKKIEKDAAPPTKSYVFPYMIVLAVLGLGVMTVCRPSKRADKPRERIKDDEE
jgi:hypothetical protein